MLPHIQSFHIKVVFIITIIIISSIIRYYL